MQYQVAIALNSEEDIQCVQTIADTMSFSFHTFLVAPEKSRISEQLNSGLVDLLILDLADKEIDELYRRVTEQPR